MRNLINQRIQDFVWGERYGKEIYDFIEKHESRNKFLNSLYTQIKYKGYLSQKQIQVVLKMREAWFNG